MSGYVRLTLINTREAVRGVDGMGMGTKSRAEMFLGWNMGR